LENLRKQGDLLYLGIQLGDRDVNAATTRVFCLIADNTGTPLEPLFEIPHISGGLYSENVKTMPLNEEVRVFYYINKADGVTPSNKYDPNVYLEVYMRDMSGEIVEENLDKKVSEVSVSVVEIVGDLSEDNELSAQLPDEDLLQANLENDLILEGDILDEC